MAEKDEVMFEDVILSILNVAAILGGAKLWITR